MPAEESSSSIWSREQDKQFEKAIVTYFNDSSDRWEKIASEVHGKSVKEVKDHYELLVDDVDMIESGFVQVPCYNSSSDGSASFVGDEGIRNGQLNNDSGHGGKSSRADLERRKGIAWTEDEHRLFLLGLDKYGKGDWRSISRNFVVTRTPTQVASHAQKYFIRLNSMNKDRRRTSIHDITTVNGGDISVSQQGPITGQVSGSSAKSNKQSPQSGPGISYGSPTIRQSIEGPLISAVGTPVNLPPQSHLAYGVRAPVHGTVVPGVPVTMGGPIKYPVPHPSALK